MTDVRGLVLRRVVLDHVQAEANVEIICFDSARWLGAAWKHVRYVFFRSDVKLMRFWEKVMERCLSFWIFPARTLEY